MFPAKFLQLPREVDYFPAKLHTQVAESLPALTKLRTGELQRRRRRPTSGSNLHCVHSELCTKSNNTKTVETCIPSMHARSSEAPTKLQETGFMSTASIIVKHLRSPIRAEFTTTRTKFNKKDGHEMQDDQEPTRFCRRRCSRGMKGPTVEAQALGISPEERRQGTERHTRTPTSCVSCLPGLQAAVARTSAPMGLLHTCRSCFMMKQERMVGKMKWLRD